MAIAFVQAASGARSTAGTSLTVTLGAAPTAGNRLFAVVTDTIGNPAATGWDIDIGAASNNFTRILSHLVGSGESASITFSHIGSNGFIAAVVAEYSGITTTTPLDQTASATGGSGLTVLDTGITSATTQADELCIAGVGMIPASATPDINAWGGEYIQRGNIVSATNVEAGMAALIVSATGTQGTSANTNNPHSFTERMVATYKAATGGGADTTPPTVSSRVVNGSTLTVTFNEAMSTNAAHLPPNSAYTVNVNGVARSVTNSSIANTGTGGVGVLTLTLASPVTAGQTVTLSYSP